MLLKPFLLLISATLVCLDVIWFQHAFRFSTQSEAPKGSQDPLLATLSAYKGWTLVNPAPVLMAPQAAIACAQAVGRTDKSPHLNKFISVYVNETGREAMTTQISPKFPPGSMIVKEKLASESSQQPELLTAMVKHEKGYNPASGDWEYLVLDGHASEIKERGSLESCNSCHAAYQQSDFVTRTYLPLETVRKLHK